MSKLSSVLDLVIHERQARLDHAGNIMNNLYRASILQQGRQFILPALQVRIPPNVLLADENVGYAALSRDLRERCLDFCAIIYRRQHQYNS